MEILEDKTVNVYSEGNNRYVVVLRAGLVVINLFLFNFIQKFKRQDPNSRASIDWKLSFSRVKKFQKIKQKFMIDNVTNLS